MVREWPAVEKTSVWGCECLDYLLLFQHTHFKGCHTTCTEHLSCLFFLSADGGGSWHSWDLSVHQVPHCHHPVAHLSGSRTVLISLYLITQCTAWPKRTFGVLAHAAALHHSGPEKERSMRSVMLSCWLFLMKFCSVNSFKWAHSRPVFNPLPPSPYTQPVII